MFSSGESVPLTGGGGSTAGSTTSSTTTSGGGGGASTTMGSTASGVSGIFRKENVEQLGNAAKVGCSNIMQSIKKGTISLRMMALSSGISVIVTAFSNILRDLFLLHFGRLLIMIYAMILGIIMVLLEVRLLSLPESLLRSLYKQLYIVHGIRGRGCLYFITGSLLWTQGGLAPIFVGSITSLTGVIFIRMGNRSSKLLSEVRASVKSEEALRNAFNQIDLQGKGHFNMEDFSLWIRSLPSSSWSLQDSEAAFMQMDSTDKGQVTFEDFRGWWLQTQDVQQQLIANVV